MTAPRRLWQIANFSCRDVSRLTSEALDREISAAENAILFIHRLYCVPCARYSRQLVQIRSAVKALHRHLESGDLPGPDLPEAARERIRQTLSEQ